MYDISSKYIGRLKTFITIITNFQNFVVTPSISYQIICNFQLVQFFPQIHKSSCYYIAI